MILRRMVQVLTQRGVHIQFIREHLMFTGSFITAIAAASIARTTIADC